MIRQLKRYRGYVIFYADIQDRRFFVKISGSMEQSEVAGLFVFSNIRIMGYFRLGSSRVKECPAVKELPQRLETPEKLL